MNSADLIQIAATLPPDRARQVLAIAAKHGERIDSLEEFKSRAAAAFEKDMQPVCTAIVDALQAGDLAALHGLRALLPSLLRQVNQSPALADLLAHQLGETFLTALQSERQPNE